MTRRKRRNFPSTTTENGEGVVTDGPVTTGKGMGWSLDLGLELVRLLTDGETAEALKKKIQYDRV